MFFRKCSLSVFALLVIAFTGSPLHADLLGVDWIGQAWRIDQCTGESVLIGPTGFTGHNSLARDNEGTFFTTGTIEIGISADQCLLTINPDTGEATEVALLNLDAATEGTVRSLAFSPNGVLYATVRTPVSAGVANLYIIDAETGDTMLVGSTGQSGVQGLAFSEDGTLYGLGPLGRLGVIDASTGVWTAVSPTAPSNFVLQSIAFGPNEVLYACDNVFETLQVVDTTTGEATLIGEGHFGDLRGIEFIPGTQPDVPPPVVACQVNVPTLWSPNHEMVDVGMTFDVTESCGHTPKVEVFVLANETDRNASVNDVEFDAEMNLRLSAERNGNGTGRVYLIVVIATDLLGQSGIECCSVVVPHSQTEAAEDIVNNNAVLAELECLETLAPPEDYYLLGGF